MNPIARFFRWLFGHSTVKVVCYDGVYNYDKRIRTGKTKLLGVEARRTR